MLTNKTVVCEHFEGKVARFVGVLIFFLHHFADALARVAAILGVAVDSDCLLQTSRIVLPVNVNPRSAGLGDGSDGGPLMVRVQYKNKYKNQ